MAIKIIAEIGWNHMGDMEIAEKMIISASKSGADYCKFQTWSEKDLKPGPWDSDGRREIYKKAQLSQEQHSKLKDICIKNKVKFLTSVFNIKHLDFVSKINSEAIKIPSHEIYNLPLIEKSTQLFDLVLTSAGACNWSELEAVANLKSNKIVFMHCVSSYPCKFENLNFPKMEKLKSLSRQIGYSGHYSGIDDAIVAISRGATFIEKHFTIDNDLPGRDNKFAILPKDMKNLSSFRSNFEDMNIDRGLNLQDCEKDIFNNYRGRWSK